MNTTISQSDQRWLEALRAQLGTGTVPVDVPVFMLPDDEIDVVKTVNNFCRLKEAAVLAKEMKP